MNGENTYRLPKGWKWVKLGDVFTIERGGSPRPIEGYITNESNGINWIKIGDTKGVSKYITHTNEKIKPEGLKKTRMVYDGDFILSNSMSFGRPYIMKTSGCIHDGWLVIRKNENVDTDYLYYSLSANAVYAQFSKLAKGSTVKNLNIDAVKQVSISLPPIAAQHAIVSKIEELFSDLDKGIEQLKIAQQQLKTYRQAVLKWAFGGKFTHEDVKEGALPEGWKWETIANLTENLDGKRIPLSREVRAGRKGPYRYYGATEIVDHINDYIFDGEYLLIGEDGANLLSKSRPLAFLVDGKFWVNNHAHVLLAKKQTLNKYLCYYFNSLDLAPFVTGTAQPKLTQGNLNKIAVPIGQIEEQLKIIEEIESRFTIADKTEEAITQSLQQAETLRQSILKMAFEGRLVPNDTLETIRPSVDAIPA